MVLRELVALFRFQYDSAPAKRATKDLDKLKEKATQSGGGLDGLWSVGKKLAGAWLAFRTALGSFNFVGHLIEMGSAAEETQNVLRETFKGNADSVLQWSQTAGKALQRSKYTLQEFASGLGAVLAPSFAELGEAGTKEVAEMSQNLTERAVDMASFFNTTEEQALNAIRSGISGEAEALKRFGVNLTEEGILGILKITKKQYKALDLAGKQRLRYQAILKMTANTEGDAIRTAEGFANASRGLADDIKDLATDLGKRLLPIAGKTIVILRKVVRGMREFTESASRMKALLALLAGALAAVMVKLGAMAIATIGVWGPIALTVLAVVAALAILYLVIEDIVVAMSGGESVFGQFLDWLMDTEGAAVILGETLAKMTLAIGEFFTGGGEHLDEFIKSWLSGFKILWERVTRMADRAANAIGEALMGALRSFLGDELFNELGLGPKTKARSTREQARALISRGGEGAIGVLPEEKGKFASSEGSGEAAMSLPATMSGSYGVVPQGGGSNTAVTATQTNTFQFMGPTSKKQQADFLRALRQENDRQAREIDALISEAGGT